MRLFTGIDLSAEVAQALEERLARLRLAARIRWSPLANLHITTRFIGEWPEERLAELRAALEAMRTPAPFPISIRRLGLFPDPQRPRVFWAGVESSAALARLAAETDGVLKGLGLPGEGRLFSPHLTLARIRARAELQGLREAVASLPPPDFGTFRAERFYLYRSQPMGGNPVYTKLTGFPL